MTKQQADSLYQLLGKKCRLGMYVATTTAKSAAKEVREWQEGDEGLPEHVDGLGGGHVEAHAYGGALTTVASQRSQGGSEERC